MGPADPVYDLHPAAVDFDRSRCRAGRQPGHIQDLSRLSRITFRPFGRLVRPGAHATAERSRPTFQRGQQPGRTRQQLAGRRGTSRARGRARY